MSTFITKSTATIEGPMIIKPTELGQGREYLKDISLTEPYAQMGIAEPLERHSCQSLARGVLCGLYFQRKDSYANFIAVTAGRVLAVVVDLRPEQSSFGAANSVELSSENEAMLYVPPYFAYGFLTLEAGTEVICNSSGQEDPASASGIIYDDEIIAINWQFERYQIDQKRLNIAGRDKKFPSFRSYNPNALWLNRPKKSKYALSRR